MSNAVYRLIDLSKWNGKVDFNRVRCAGIDGVIIRTGFGVENPRQVDRRFEEYYSGAKAAGLYVGAYHYRSKHSATGWKMQALGQAFTVMIRSSGTNSHLICSKDTPCGPQG